MKDYYGNLSVLSLLIYAIIIIIVLLGILFLVFQETTENSVPASEQEFISIVTAGISTPDQTSETAEIVEPRPDFTVWPRDATLLPPITIGSLIVKAIPKNSEMGWDHLRIPNVKWVTEGFDVSETGYTSRAGIVRVRAGPQVTKILRQDWEELAWTIELTTFESAKWGPTSIEIRPGLYDVKYEGKYVCYGTGFEGCSFELNALSDKNLKLTKVCEIGTGAGRSVVFLALTSDGRQGTVVYQGSGGSGGWSNSVEISILSSQEYCKKNKDRGY